MSYADFLASKKRPDTASGHHVEPGDLHPSLFPHQQEAVRWAVERGRAATFLDTGLGKSRIQLAWADAMADSALIVAPLTIAKQTVREAAAIDLELSYVRSPDDVTGPGLWITNYELVDRFDMSRFGALVLDESSILKNHTGATRNMLVALGKDVPYLLACTATPAPNDHTELANHAEFLRVMSRTEMLAAFFVHDQDGWRLKGHAADAMYQWMSTWAIAARKPSDLGPFDDSLYELPPLNIHSEVCPYEHAPEGQLFATQIGGVSDRAALRRDTMPARVARAVEILNQDDQPGIAWCGLNPEAEAVAADTKGAENLHGSMAPEAKSELIEAFVAGDVRVLVTKPSIAGFGLNFQHARRQVFVGIGDSYESYYQAIRRSWRFGQDQPVNVHVVVTDLEQEIVQNVRRKEKEADAMTAALVEEINR